MLDEKALLLEFNTQERKPAIPAYERAGISLGNHLFDFSEEHEERDGEDASGDLMEVDSEQQESQRQNIPQLTLMLMGRKDSEMLGWVIQAIFEAKEWENHS